MPKRSSASSSAVSDSQAARDSSPITSDYDQEIKPSPSKKSKTRAKGGAGKKGKDENKDRQAPRSWTSEEEAVFVEIATEQLKKTLWQAIKDDGRLEYRCCPGVRAHLIDMMNKVKKDMTGQ